PIIISHYSYFFFTATATTNIYTLSLHDALPIYQKKDGSVIDVEVSWHRLNFSGRPAKLVLANDVTERQRAEEALAAERNLLRTLIDELPDRIYVKDTESRFLLNNKSHIAALGAESQEDMLGKTDFDFRPAE